MITPPRLFKSSISVLLSFTLIVLSPGAGWEALAVTFKAPRGGVKVLPGVGNQPVRLPRLSAGTPGSLVGSNDLKPGLASPVPHPTPILISELISESAAPAIIAPEPATAPADIGEAKRDLPGIAAEIQPDIQAASELSKAPAETAPGIGRRLIDVLLGRKKTMEPVESALPDAVITEAPQTTIAAPLARRHSRKTESILDEIKSNPPAAVILDYDGTMTGRNAQGLSTLPTDELVSTLVDLLKAGAPVGIITGRTLDYSPVEDVIPMAIWKTLIERIPPEHRKNLFFSGRIGSEFVRFDAQGHVIRLFDQDWSPREKSAIRASIREAMRFNGLSKKDRTLIEVPGLTNIVFRPGERRLSRFARTLKKEFNKRSIRANIHQSHEWVFFSRNDKSSGLQMMYTSMKEAGFPVREDNLLIVGDNFATPKNGHPGGDAASAAAFPQSRALTVGDDYAVPLPKNVRRLGLNADAGTLAVLQAVLENLKTPLPEEKPAQDKPAEVTPPSDAEMEEFYRSERQRSLRAAAITLPLALMPLLWSMAGPAAFAIAGSVVLTFIGIPQIIKNFRDGPEGTKGLAPASTLIWFSASVLLTVTSLLRGASVWWLASNAAGVIQSLIILAQLNGHRKDASLLKTSALVVGGMLAAAAPMLFAVGLSGAAWAAVAFNTAMALLFVLNWPQIRKNYQIYKKDGTTPSSIAWQYMAMVVAGSILTGITAALTGDLFWLANSLMGIIMPAIVLGQIFLAKPVNAALDKVMPAALWFESALINAYNRLFGRRV